MRAIRVHEFGGPEVLHLEEVPDLKPGAGSACSPHSRGWREPRRHLHAHGNVHAETAASLHSGNGRRRHG